jgi:hypothetical protein
MAEQKTKCEPCKTAATNPHSGGYQTKCQGCKTRHLAKSIPYWQSSREKRITAPYKAALVATFGNDWEAGHSAVKAEAVRLGGVK